MKNEEKELTDTDKLIIRIKLENTHTYWAVLIISKIDDPAERKIKLESYDYTLTDIQFKDRGYIKKMVVKEFNQKMREKYEPDYRVSPILKENLYLTREEAEKSMEKTKKAYEVASQMSKKGD